MLAREAAARSIVLLENRAGVLPLGPSVRHLAVVGPMAEDVPVLLANYHGIPTRPVTLLDGVRAAAEARGLGVGYAPGARLVDTSPATIAAAVAVARDADAVIAFVGPRPRLEGEEHGEPLQPGGDRQDLDMPAAQQRAGRGVAGDGQAGDRGADGGQRARAALGDGARGCHRLRLVSGRRGRNAVADVLFGDVNPAGRLPITIYRSAADLPPFASYDMRGRTYRYFDGAPLYGFGYGLSYTTFRYAQIGAVAGVFAAAAVEIENTGSRAGDEVVAGLRRPAQRPAVCAAPLAGGVLACLTQAGRASGGEDPVRAQRAHLRRRGGYRRPLDGDVDIAVGGQQPGRDGRYPDTTVGSTTTLHLGR